MPEETRETHYWYRLIHRLNLGDTVTRKALLKEAYEVKLMFGAMESRTRV